MKFAREYQEHLRNEGFPEHWVSSAISYGQLKKCIKRVTRELTALGLDVPTLQRLLQSVETTPQTPPSGSDGSLPAETATSVEQKDEAPQSQEKPFQYLFSGPSIDAGPVKPQLLFVVDADTGEPLDAGLAPETRNYLHQLAVAERLTDIRIADEGESLTRSTTRSSEGGPDSARRDNEPDARQSKYAGRPTRLVSVPLTSDSEFFEVLEKELCGLAELQKAQQAKLTAEIVAVGRRLGKATNPSDSRARTDLNHWRRLFELYLESNIFFATCEQDHGVHGGERAQKQYEHFIKQATKAGLLNKFKKAESAKTFQLFLDINNELLQCLKFQEINQVAMKKILKKFDKRTALGAKVTFPSHLPPSLVSADFSKALSSEVSNNIIAVVPQLDDYLCPICFQLAYRPIRLRCSHLFCIRCLIVMQREGKDKCPLCREPCVLDADSTNLDKSMQNFLKRYFHDEAKKKQRDNEKAIYQEQYPGSEETCVVM